MEKNSELEIVQFDKFARIVRLTNVEKRTRQEKFCVLKKRIGSEKQVKNQVVNVFFFKLVSANPCNANSTHEFSTITRTLNKLRTAQSRRCTCVGRENLSKQLRG